MAFSLLDHLQNSRQADIQALLPTLDPDRQRELVAIVLGRLIVLDRTHSPALYQSITAQDHSLFWQDLDDHAISQLAAATTLSSAEFKTAIDQLYGYVSEEINSLDSTANLEQAGVSELIQGQADYLPDAAPDQVWGALNLAELQGKTISTEAPVDLNASIASLSKLMMDASQMTTKSPDHTAHHDLDLAHDDHAHQHGHTSIELPAQRPAPRVFMAIEPLIALLILIALWMIYNNLAGY